MIKKHSLNQNQKKEKFSKSYIVKQPPIRNHFSAHPLINLQQTIGNRAMQGLFQAKLKISQPGDIYEQEADQVADQVMRMPEPESRGDKQPHIYRKEEHTLVSPETSIADNFLSSLGPGRALDSQLRAFFEPRFGYDFSSVRVHTDSRAEEMAQEVNARAFTVGRDVVFGEGEHNPGTSDGKKLLAHELSHIVQQKKQIARQESLKYKPHVPIVPSEPEIKELKELKEIDITKLKLPWTNRPKNIRESENSIELFESRNNGIHFLVGVQGTTMVNTVKKAIPDIATRMKKDNIYIKDPLFKVEICFIIPSTTKFASFKEKPVLVLNPVDVNKFTTSHEMGHAIFDYLLNSNKSENTKGRNFVYRIADIYNRLKLTKKIDLIGESTPKAAGLLIVDISQIKPGSKAEHPWDNPDEFFASAKEVYQADRTALQDIIRRYAKKYDPNISKPAQELITLLDEFFNRSRLPIGKIPREQEKEAKLSLLNVGKTTKVETLLSESKNIYVRWLLIPGKRLNGRN